MLRNFYLKSSNISEGFRNNNNNKNLLNVSRLNHHHPMMKKNFNNSLSVLFCSRTIGISTRSFSKNFIIGMKPNLLFSSINYDFFLKQQQQQHIIRNDWGLKFCNNERYYTSRKRAIQHQQRLKKGYVSPDHALYLYDRWKGEGKQISGKLYSQLLQLCCRGANFKTKEYLKRAQELFSEMKETKIEIKSMYYDLMIQISFRSKEPELALQYYEEMKKEGLPETQITFGSLIRCCALNNQPEKAKEFYDIMIQKELAPSEIPFERFYIALKTL